jgi:ubiquinone/menaquinone biosynthesis C-methylase UbiE
MIHSPSYADSVMQGQHPATGYFFGADESERARLLAQGEVHRAETEALLDRLELPVGGRAVDFGCGPLGVLDMLSRRVGPAGDVIGLDSEPRMIGFAQRSVAERGLDNVTLIRADARAAGLKADSFDLAHERLVLITLTSLQAVVDEMVRVVRPGGWVIMQNVDWITWACEPAHPAWDSLLDALVKTWKSIGLNPSAGRRMPALLRDAKLTDVTIEVSVHTQHAGEPNQLLLLRFIDIFRDQIVRGGTLDAPQLTRLTAELTEHLARPETFTLQPLLFQAWGRKPGK